MAKKTRTYVVTYTVLEGGWPDDDVHGVLIFKKSRDAYKCATLIARAEDIDMVKVKCEGD